MFSNKQKVCFFQAVTICKNPYLNQECTGISISRHHFWVDCGVAEFLWNNMQTSSQAHPACFPLSSHQAWLHSFCTGASDFTSCRRCWMPHKTLATYSKPHRTGNCCYSNSMGRGLKQKGQRRR